MKNIYLAVLFSLLLSCNKSQKNIVVRVIDEKSQTSVSNARVFNIDTKEEGIKKNEYFLLKGKANDKIGVYAEGYDSSQFQLNTASKDYIVNLKPKI